jgi:hypothetical protein
MSRLIILSSGSEKRGPGRPRVEQQLSPVSTRIEVASHDFLIRSASRQRVSVSCLLRNLIESSVKARRGQL